jgi:REP element-mobilizing transposase RayT
MTNHFHLLLEVPRPTDPLPSEEVMLTKLARLSGHQDVEAVRQRFAMYRRCGDVEGETRYLARFHARLWDVSVFMKLLKQRFSQWFNGRTGRKGTLWEERFKSVLVEGMGHALATMAGYIDLNPVRAGLVQDPKDYRWSGYGEAVAGKTRARLGLQSVVKALMRGKEEAVSRSLEIYRMHVYQEGSEGRETVGEDGRAARGALTREEVEEVLRQKGQLTVGEYLRCRVRYFCDGTVFGSREFVEGIFRGYRERFGPKRQSGARPMRGLKADEALFTLRALRMRVFG